MEANDEPSLPTDMTASDQAGRSPNPLSMNLDDSSNSSSSTDDGKPSRPSIVLTLLSGIFAALFIAVAFFFENDDGLLGIQTVVYYCYQAAASILSIVHRYCFPDKCRWMIKTVMTVGLIWSIIVLVTKIRKNGGENDKEDQDELYNNEGVDLTFAGLGAACSIFHTILEL
jgi:hypothetical protein